MNIPVPNLQRLPIFTLPLVITPGPNVQSSPTSEWCSIEQYGLSLQL